jgi:hypothetical protein
MSKRRLVIELVLVLVASVFLLSVMDFDDDGLYNIQKFFNYNPVVEYALSKELPSELVERLRPLGTYNMDDFEKGTINELSNLGQDIHHSLVSSAIDSILEDEKIDSGELCSVVMDWDGDYIRNDWEVNEYGTDPFLIDSDGGGMDDFNEIYTYPIYNMNPKNPEDDTEFIGMLPDVVARHWELDDGGVGD